MNKLLPRPPVRRGPLRLLRRVQVGLLAAAFGALSAAQAAEPALGESLDELLAYAREHNPDLAASTLEADAAHARVEPAAALPDPRFQLELMDVTNTTNPGRSTSLLPGEVGTTRYRVIQPLPFWGKRDLRGEVAAAQAGRADALRERTRVELEFRIKSAFVQHYQAFGRSRILDETLALVDLLEQVATARYSVGLVPQQDVIRAQSERTALKVELLEAERRRRDAAAKLNAALARDPRAELAPPRVLPAGPEKMDLALLAERVRAASPEIAGERAGMLAAQKSRELTWLNRYPDFAVGVTYNRPAGGDSNWDVMLELNIPLQQSARRAQERAAVAGEQAAEARVAAAEARQLGRLGEAWAGFESSREKAGLLRDTLLPQAYATLESARAGYETGRVNFNTVIEAQRQILRTRLALLDAEADTALRLAELELLAGGSL